MIDANKHMRADEDGIISLATICNLTDIHAYHHEGINNIATYARGSKRIDFILTSKTLVQKTTASGFLAFYDGIESNHRGSFVDFDADRLFKGKTTKIYTQAQRNLTSKKPTATKIKAQASEKPVPANLRERTE